MPPKTLTSNSTNAISAFLTSGEPLPEKLSLTDVIDFLTNPPSATPKDSFYTGGLATSTVISKVYEVWAQQDHVIDFFIAQKFSLQNMRLLEAKAPRFMQVALTHSRMATYVQALQNNQRIRFFNSTHPHPLPSNTQQLEIIAAITNFLRFEEESEIIKLLSSSDVSLTKST